MSIFSEKKSANFNNPTQLPDSEQQSKEWLAKNKAWWEEHSMRYDWNDPISAEPFSRAYFEEIDRRFFSAAHNFLPWRKVPFDSLIPFDRLMAWNVLEIGVGNGSHAQLLAAHSKSFHGIDLTEFAVSSTQKRMAVFGIENATIQQMNAERMTLPDGFFDYVWSWGVIHHSADTSAILSEIHRVLRPGGSSAIMVYHRGWFNYYFIGFFILGLIRGGLFKTGSLHKTVQNSTDGAMARYYSPADLRKELSKHFLVKEISVYGDKVELVPLPGSRLKKSLVRLIPDSLGRFFTHLLKMGSMLYAVVEKEK